jgi:hypothetical protein
MAIPGLMDEIMGYDAWVVSGLWPPKHLLDGVSEKQVRFIGYDKTCFEPDPDDTDVPGSVMEPGFAETFFHSYIYVIDKTYKYCRDQGIYDLQDRTESMRQELEYIRREYPVSGWEVHKTFEGFLRFHEKNR